MYLQFGEFYLSVNISEEGEIQNDVSKTFILLTVPRRYFCCGPFPDHCLLFPFYYKSCRKQRNSPDLCFAIKSIQIYDP